MGQREDMRHADEIANIIANSTNRVVLLKSVPGSEREIASILSECSKSIEAACERHRTEANTEEST
jgi:hypothetical protein